jgi:hypothetical protein
MDQKIAIRQEMRKSMNDEIATRTKLHQEKIAAFTTAVTGRMRAMAAAPTVPLALLAHGDSWFDYPLSGNNPGLSHTDVTVQLGSMGNVNPYVLNISQWGDATTAEMSWPRQQRMITALQDPANWFSSGEPDAILFSGGGNDIAGDQFCIFLDYATFSAAGLNAIRFQDALGMVESSYLDLFAFRDRYAPGVPIFGHCYDFPIPNGVHPICAGPWLKPALDFCGYDLTQGTAIVRQALVDFKNRLMTLSSNAANDFVLVDTQGSLQAADWANELHPYRQGFATIAGKFVDALRVRFPGRI